MYHKIGVLAKRFGITPQALRFYEQHGLLVPDRPEEGGARRYHTRNFKWLYSIRRYHDLGFRMEETLSLFACETPQALSAMVGAKEAETLSEIRALERRLSALGRQREDLARIARLLHRCEVADMPRLWLLIDQDGQRVDPSPALQEEVRAWMRLLPWVYAASVLDRSALLRPESVGARKSGFLVEADTAEEIGLSPGVRAVCLEGGRAIHTVTTLDRPNATTGNLLGHVLDYAQERGLTIRADAVGRCLAKTGELQCQEDLCPRSVYYEYWLPIEGV